MRPWTVGMLRTGNVLVRIHIQMRARSHLRNQIRRSMPMIRRGRTGTVQSRLQRPFVNTLLRECLNATDRNFQGLLRTLFLVDVSLRKLFSQLVASQVIYKLAYIFRAIFYRVDHAGNDERELDLKGWRFRLIVIAWY